MVLIMKQYKAENGDRLDQIIYKEYKTLSVFDKVIAYNPILATKPILSDGDLVNLPTIDIKITPKAKKLW
jgi:phage tail protein X